jgi:hypothetical protein
MRCHFEQGEKSFLDPLHPLGMTDFRSVNFARMFFWALTACHTQFRVPTSELDLNLKREAASTLRGMQ